MWTLWLIPLVFLSLVVGAILALLWFFTSGKNPRQKILTAAAIPIGCASIPIVGLILVGTVGALLTKSDTQLYEEIFGYRPSITEDRMLFDNFGSGHDREIFMRAEPAEAELKKLINIPGLKPSNVRFEAFVGRGASHGFLWWISNDPDDDGYCKSAQIFTADGFREWKELLIAKCIDAGSEFPASANVRMIYVVAFSHIEN